MGRKKSEREGFEMLRDGVVEKVGERLDLRISRGSFEMRGDVELLEGRDVFLRSVSGSGGKVYCGIIDRVELLMEGELKVTVKEGQYDPFLLGDSLRQFAGAGDRGEIKVRDEFDVFLLRKEIVGHERGITLEFRPLAILDRDLTVIGGLGNDAVRKRGDNAHDQERPAKEDEAANWDVNGDGKLNDEEGKRINEALLKVINQGGASLVDIGRGLAGFKAFDVRYNPEQPGVWAQTSYFANVGEATFWQSSGDKAKFYLDIRVGSKDPTCVCIGKGYNNARRQFDDEVKAADVFSRVRNELRVLASKPVLEPFEEVKLERQRQEGAEEVLQPNPNPVYQAYASVFYEDGGDQVDRVLEKRIEVSKVLYVNKGADAGTLVRLVCDMGVDPFAAYAAYGIRNGKPIKAVSLGIVDIVIEEERLRAIIE